MTRRHYINAHIIAAASRRKRSDAEMLRVKRAANETPLFWRIMYLVIITAALAMLIGGFIVLLVHP